MNDDTPNAVSNAQRSFGRETVSPIKTGLTARAPIHVTWKYAEYLANDDPPIRTDKLIAKGFDRHSLKQAKTDPHMSNGNANVGLVLDVNATLKTAVQPKKELEQSIDRRVQSAVILVTQA